MANLLSTATSVANAVTAASNIDVSGSSLTNAGVNAALSAATAITAGQDPLSAAASSALGSIPGASSIASAANSLFGGSIGGLSGTKPQALHTEYAAGGANWTKPYGAGTDITFYLQRADVGGGGATSPLSAAAEEAGFGDSAGLSGLNEGLAAAAGTVSEAAVPADIVAGAGLPDGMSSALNQVASAASMTGSLGSAFSAVPSLAGPLSGISEGLSTATSIATSATAAINNPSISNITAAVGSTSAFGSLSNTINNSVAASEAFFNETLNASFNTAADVVDGVTSLAAAPVSEFSSSMAKMTGAVTSTTDFVQGINDGLYGYTSTAAAAEMERASTESFEMY